MTRRRYCRPCVHVFLRVCVGLVRVTVRDLYVRVSPSTRQRAGIGVCSRASCMSLLPLPRSLPCLEHGTARHSIWGGIGRHGTAWLCSFGRVAPGIGFGPLDLYTAWTRFGSAGNAAGLVQIEK